MIAAVYYGPEDLRLEDRPMPVPRKGEVVVRVNSVGICGTDIRILKGAHRKFGPGTIRVPGHEVVATVSEVGSGVSDQYVGERVFIAPNVGCGRCAECLRGQNNLCANYDAIGITRDGGFAEYMRLPAPFLEQGNLIPFDNSLDSAAVALAEPFACVLRGQNPLKITNDDTVLVIGAGPIGIMHTIAAKAAGARKILVSDGSAEHRRMATSAGAARTVNFREESLTDAVMDETGGRGADVVIIAAGSRDAMESAPELAAIGGRINLFAGLPAGNSSIALDANAIHYKELVVTGTTGCSTSDCRQAIESITSGGVDLAPLVSARFQLDEIADAFATARTGNVFKVVLENEKER